MSMSPIVSIIVPVYNLERYLSETLDCIMRQTFSDWVCIIVNDGSTDHSQSIIDEYCKKDKRFQGFKKENEKSADLARKYGLQFVATEFVQHIDGDDLIEDDFVERLIRRQNETNADCVVARLVGCDDKFEKENYRIPAEGFDMNQIVSGRDACAMTIGGWGLSGNVMLYRRELANKVAFGPCMNSDEFSQRQILYNAQTVVFEDTHYLYRGNDGTSVTMSARFFDRTLVDRQLETFVKEFFSDRPDKINAIVSQRLFNLIYLTADYYKNQQILEPQDAQRIRKFLRSSFKALDRVTMRKILPYHNLFIGHSWLSFNLFSRVYVAYKRSHGGAYNYK